MLFVFEKQSNAMETNIRINFNENETAEKNLIKKVQLLRFKENLTFKEISTKLRISKSKVISYCTDLKFKI